MDERWKAGGMSEAEGAPCREEATAQSRASGGRCWGHVHTHIHWRPSQHARGRKGCKGAEGCKLLQAR